VEPQGMPFAIGGVVSEVSGTFGVAGCWVQVVFWLLF